MPPSPTSGDFSGEASGTAGGTAADPCYPHGVMCADGGCAKFAADCAKNELYCLKDDLEKAIITDKLLDPIDKFADDK